MKLKLLMATTMFVMGTTFSYAGHEEGDFWSNEKVDIKSKVLFEDQAGIKVRLTGEIRNIIPEGQGEVETVNKTTDFSVLTRDVGFRHYDAPTSGTEPHSRHLYETSVLLGQKIVTLGHFESQNTIVYHTRIPSTERRIEDSANEGEWANIYNVSKYIRPDNTEHEACIRIGQYMYTVNQKLLKEGERFWDGTLLRKTIYPGVNLPTENRYCNFTADVWEIETIRHERASESETAKIVSIELKEIIKDKRNETYEDIKGSFQALTIPS